MDSPAATVAVDNTEPREGSLSEEFLTAVLHSDAPRSYLTPVPSRLLFLCGLFVGERHEAPVTSTMLSPCFFTLSSQLNIAVCPCIDRRFVYVVAVHQSSGWKLAGLTLVMVLVHTLFELSAAPSFALRNGNWAARVVPLLCLVVAWWCMIRCAVRGAGVLGAAHQSEELPHYKGCPAQVTMSSGTVIRPYRKSCHTCGILRPFRCAHCRHCNVCVDQFDHHCFITGACVGRRNARLFVTFLSLTALYGIIIFVICVVGFYNMPDSDAVHSSHGPFAVGVMIACLFSFVPLIPASCLYLWLYCVKGTTWREHKKGGGLYKDYELEKVAPTPFSDPRTCGNCIRFCCS